MLPEGEKEHLRISGALVSAAYQAGALPGI